MQFLVYFYRPFLGVWGRNFTQSISILRSVHSYLVFNVRRKTPSLTAGSRCSSGSEFQTVSDRPSVLRRYCVTIKRCRLADRRCRLATSATGVQQLTRYLDASFSRHRRTMTASLYFTRSGTLLHPVCPSRASDFLEIGKPYKFCGNTAIENNN